MEAPYTHNEATNDTQDHIYENEMETVDSLSEDLEQFDPQEHQFEEAKEDSLFYLLNKSTQKKPNNTKPFIQPKLKIGSPNDRYEQEADRMADLVVNQISKGQLNAIKKPKKPIIQQKRATLHQEMAAPPSIAQKLKQKKGQGNPLPTIIRAKMEQGFGTNFNQVRIHTGSDAIQMNQQLGARAFTYGSNVYFNREEYQPSLKEGQRLLAHELSHTIQQSSLDNRIQRSGIRDTAAGKSATTASLMDAGSLQEIEDALIKEYRRKKFQIKSTSSKHKKAKLKSELATLHAEIKGILQGHYGISGGVSEIMMKVLSGEIKSRSTNISYNKAYTYKTQFFRRLRTIKGDFIDKAKKLAFGNFKGVISQKYPQKKDESWLSLIEAALSLVPYGDKILKLTLKLSKKMGKTIKISIKTLRKYQKVKNKVEEYAKIGKDGAKNIAVTGKLTGIGDTQEKEISEEVRYIEFKLDFFRDIRKELLLKDIETYAKNEKFETAIEDLLLRLELTPHAKIDLLALVKDLLGPILEINENALKTQLEKFALLFELYLYKKFYKEIPNVPKLYLRYNGRGHVIYSEIKGGGKFWDSKIQGNILAVVKKVSRIPGSGIEWDTYGNDKTQLVAGVLRFSRIELNERGISDFDYYMREKAIKTGRRGGPMPIP